MEIKYKSILKRLRHNSQFLAVSFFILMIASSSIQALNAPAYLGELYGQENRLTF